MPRTRYRAAATAAVLVLALTGCGDDGGNDAVSPTSSASASSSPSATAQETPATPAPGGSTAVAVYYLMDTTNGPRLYREFHSRPEADDPVAEAVSAMLEEPADDTDYSSLWPEGAEVLGTSRDGDLLTVDLSRSALDGQAGSSFEALSVQQLVHTATAAAPDAARVQLTFDGETEQDLWGAVSVGEPISRAPSSEVLGPVWVLTPSEDGTIAQGEQFGGVATVFEATVSWQWLQGDRVVAEGFSTASEGAPGRGEWSSTVDVPPGDYVLKAFESSARDGSETFVETKTVTVTG